jgi:hypothetical protein
LFALAKTSQSGATAAFLKEVSVLIAPSTMRIHPKIPCLPGLHPVNNDGIATGELGGIVDLNGLKHAVSMSLRKFGKTPCSAREDNTSKGAPSKSIITTLLGFILGVLH